MDKEHKRQIEVYIQILCCLLFAIFYSLGGLGHGLYLRRVVGSIWLAVTMFFFSNWDWRTLIVAPAMCMALSLPYGGDDLFIKIMLRLSYGLTSALSGSIYLIFKKKWLLMGFYAFIVVSAFIVLGVFNPLDARSEETLLALLISLIPVLSLSRLKED